MKNKYKVDGDTTIIYVPYKDTVFETFISTSDLDRVLAHTRSWNIKDYTDRSAGFRVLGRVVDADGTVVRTSLHRFIANAPKDMQVDHIDNNPLNNRSDNLRLATPHQNQQNRAGAMRNSKSGIRGVSWSNPWGWRAQISFYGKQHHLGWFDTKEEAEKVVKEARAKFYPFSKEGMAKEQDITQEAA